MNTIAFDTLKLAQRFEAAGLPSKQAQEMASAIGEAIADLPVTREHFDLRLGSLREELDTRLGGIREELDFRLGGMRNELDIRLREIQAAMATKVELADAKSDILKWMFGAVVAILGGVAALLRVMH